MSSAVLRVEDVRRVASLHRERLVDAIEVRAVTVGLSRCVRPTDNIVVGGDQQINRPSPRVDLSARFPSFRALRHEIPLCNLNHNRQVFISIVAARSGTNNQSISRYREIHARARARR